MDISSLAKKPQLVDLTIDDADIVEKYGEAITFYMIDEMGIDTYFAFYRLQQGQQAEELNALLRKIILKSDGTPALGDGEVLPVDLTLAVLVKVNDFLGKSDPKTSQEKTGTSQK